MGCTWIILKLPPAPDPGLWKSCLPQNQSLMPGRLEIAAPTGLLYFWPAHLAHWLMLVLLRAAAVSACLPLITTIASLPHMLPSSHQDSRGDQFIRTFRKLDYSMRKTQRTAHSWYQMHLGSWSLRPRLHFRVSCSGGSGLTSTSISPLWQGVVQAPIHLRVSALEWVAETARMISLTYFKAFIFIDSGVFLPRMPAKEKLIFFFFQGRFMVWLGPVSLKI